ELYSAFWYQLMSQGFAHPVAPGTPRRLPVDAATLGERLKECFASLDDPRVERGQLQRTINYPKVTNTNWSPLIIALKFARSGVFLSSAFPRCMKPIIGRNFLAPR
ncbi:MAG TPA: hypothetical protein V6C46_03625, partial [Coleofasciculaceae cyanobacterium]